MCYTLIINSQLTGHFETLRLACLRIVSQAKTGDHIRIDREYLNGITETLTEETL